MLTLQQAIEHRGMFYVAHRKNGAGWFGPFDGPIENRMFNNEQEAYDMIMSMITLPEEFTPGGTDMAIAKSGFYVRQVFEDYCHAYIGRKLRCIAARTETEHVIATLAGWDRGVPASEVARVRGCGVVLRTRLPVMAS